MFEGTTSSPSNLTYKYLGVLEMAVTGSLTAEAGRCPDFVTPCPAASLLPYDARLRANGMDWPRFGHTMVGHKRLKNIQQAIINVTKNGVQGDYAYLQKLYWTSLKVPAASTCFDAFETLPLSAYGTVYGFLRTSEEQVRRTFDTYGVFDERVIFHKGLFKDTLPAFRKHFTCHLASGWQLLLTCTRMRFTICTTWCQLAE